MLIKAMPGARAILIVLAALLLSQCGRVEVSSDQRQIPDPEYFLTREQTHNKFSSSIKPVLTVPAGAVIQVETEEASDKQLSIDSRSEDVSAVQFDPIHPLTGPVFVQGAMPGDVLAVTLHSIEVGEWAWSAVFPGFGFLKDEFTQPYLKTFSIAKGATKVQFSETISIPLRPFAGVMGVAPATDSLLSTIPPRSNGGNMDDPSLVAGTTVYFPVFVEGGLFSIGDTHAAQGLGEVCGTGIEAPMRIVYEVNVIKGKSYIKEPHYETESYYAVTGFGTTIKEAAEKATRYMIDYLAAEHNLDRTEAYVLCSLAADLKIAELVDEPHVLVNMHIAKEVLGREEQ